MDSTQPINLSETGYITAEDFAETLSDLSYEDFLKKFCQRGIVSKDDPYLKGVFNDGNVVQNLVDHMKKAVVDNTEGSLADNEFIQLFICLSMSFNALSAHGIGPGWKGFIELLVYDDAYERCISEEHGNLLCNYPRMQELPEKVVVAIATPFSWDEAAALMASMGSTAHPGNDGAVIPAATMDPISTFDSSISNPSSSPNPPSTPPPSTPKKEHRDTPPPPPIKSCIKRGNIVIESDSVEGCKTLFKDVADYELKEKEEETKQTTEEELTKRTQTTEVESTKRTTEQELTKRTTEVESTKRTAEKTKQLELELQIMQTKLQLQQAQQPQQQQPPPPSIPPSQQQPAAMIPSSGSSRSSAPAVVDTFTPTGEEWETLLKIDGKKTFPAVNRLNQHLAPVTCGHGWEVAGKVKALKSHQNNLKTKTFRCRCTAQHQAQARQARLRVVQVCKTFDDGTTSYSFLFERNKYDCQHSTGEQICAAAAAEP